MEATLVSEFEPIDDVDYPHGRQKALSIGAPMYWGMCMCGRKDTCLRYTRNRNCRDKQTLVMRKRQGYKGDNTNGRTRLNLK